MADEHVRPVFVTSHGGERRRVRWLGRAVAVALALWLAAVAFGGAGFATLPPLRLHGAGLAGVSIVRRALSGQHPSFVKLRAAAPRDRDGRT